MVSCWRYWRGSFIPTVIPCEARGLIWIHLSINTSEAKILIEEDPTLGLVHLPR
jgi:hypothetical protein